MVADFDSGTGQLGAATLAAESGSPSFLAVHPTGKYLYAVGEMASAGRKGGAVSAFAVQQPEGRLRLINQVDSQGGALPHFLRRERADGYGGELRWGQRGLL